MSSTILMKTAFITGASEGLGREFTQQLAALGYKTVSAARNEARLKDLQNELKGEHEYLLADLSTAAGIEVCVLYLAKHRVNLFINNAGFSHFGEFRESDVNKESSILHVNCEALMRLSHAFLQQAQAGDGLINLSSITNDLTTPIQATYCATKCFIASFSESLWFQERKRNIYVQALLPGITKTQFIERSSDIEGKKMDFLNMISQSPQAVVKTSLSAYTKRKGPIVIPGFHNRVMVGLLRLLPRKWVVLAMGNAGELA